MATNILPDLRLLPISEIRIGERHRKDLGDLDALATSIERDLLQPIGVSPELELIWGYRRLVAARDVLNRNEILCRVVRVASIVEGELAENLLRKEFTPSERVAIVDALRGYAQGGDRRSDQSRKCDVGRLTTKAASGLVGFCRDDYFRARQVVEQGEPELVQAMDSGAISISAAAEIARAEPEVQRNIVSRGGREAAWAAKEVRSQSRQRHGRGRPVEARTPCLGRPWTITSDQAVIPCDAVITDPPFGVTTKEWDQDIERTTRAWASAWNESEAHFICTFFSQKYLFEGRRWFDESLSKYKFVQLLSVCYSNYNLRLENPGEFERNWDVLLLYRRRGSKRWINPSDARWTTDFAPFAAMTFTCPKSNIDGPDRKVHSFQKSLACMKWLVQSLTEPGELVADPFAGSGTTGLAAVQLDRRAHLIEIDGECRDLAEQRLADWGQAAIVASTPPISTATSPTPSTGVKP
jgi:DNA modification methylase